MTNSTLPLATTITGSLPRPHWFTENLRGRPFLTAMGSDFAYREQYSDAVAALISDQGRAGLDIVSDGEMRFDTDIGGRSWFGYLFDRMTGLGSADVRAGGAEWNARSGAERRTDTPGDILHEVMQSRMPPLVTGPVGPGPLQYDAIWKTAQRLTHKPVKLGSCSGQMIDKMAVNRFYKDRRDSRHGIVGGAQPGAHAARRRGLPDHPDRGALRPLRFRYPMGYSRRHLCRGAQSRGSRAARQDRSVVSHLLGQSARAAHRVRATRTNPCCPTSIVSTSTSSPSRPRTTMGPSSRTSRQRSASTKRSASASSATERSQVEMPEEVATLIRKALKHIAPERLILSSDCGFGRQGMSRIHAFYKMIAIVRGANIVRYELGLPQVEIPATDPQFAWIC